MITFCPLTLGDLSLILKWFQKPHVKQWYCRGEDYPYDRIYEKYAPRINDAKRIPNFIVMDDDKPIGYFQYYFCDYSLPDEMTLEDPLFHTYVPQEVIGFDMFIGEEEYLRKGYGQKMIQYFLALNVGKVYVVDPDHRNIAMIKLLEKCGFQTYKKYLVTIVG